MRINNIKSRSASWGNPAPPRVRDGGLAVEGKCDWEHEILAQTRDVHFSRFVREFEGLRTVKGNKCMVPKDKQISSHIGKGLELKIEIARGKILKIEGYSVNTFNRVANLLREINKTAWEKCRETIPLPDIVEGPDGSIELDWQHEDFGLLVNMPADPSKPGEIYGESKKKLKAVIDGPIDPTSLPKALITWLLGMK